MSRGPCVRPAQSSASPPPRRTSSRLRRCGVSLRVGSWKPSAKRHKLDQLFGTDPAPSPGGAARESAPGAPLATRMRPRALDEFVGQERLLAAGSALRRAVEEGHPHSMILHGPPGAGKTTLARIVAESSDAAFEEESAVAAGRAEVRAVIERARERLRGGRKTIFFLDEIHRFNKAQQDALLPAVEEGLVTLIGATTENPYFEANSALLSRLRVYALQALTPEEVAAILRRAAELARSDDGADREKAHGARPRAPEGEDAALEFLAARSQGGGRTAP